MVGRRLRRRHRSEDGQPAASLGFSFCYRCLDRATRTAGLGSSVRAMLLLPAREAEWWRWLSGGCCLSTSEMRVGFLAVVFAGGRSAREGVGGLGV
ncbi:unnamed protein product [Linum trigynum]|uniref:Uncharacterized protein n=1 Tax=Linum trigynum TaxID=586398 RepID=A0AAV2ETX6_9ROSI